MKITDYKTAAGSNGNELDEAVQEFISKGYQPYGSPYLSDNRVSSGTGEFWLFQAMVMDDEKDEEKEHDEAAARQVATLNKLADTKVSKKLRS